MKKWPELPFWWTSKTPTLPSNLKKMKKSVCLVYGFNSNHTTKWPFWGVCSAGLLHLRKRTLIRKLQKTTNYTKKQKKNSCRILNNSIINWQEKLKGFSIWIKNQNAISGEDVETAKNEIVISIKQADLEREKNFKKEALLRRSPAHSNLCRPSIATRWVWATYPSTKGWVI